MHTIKITHNLLLEYQCTSHKFIRLPNRMEKIDSVARIQSNRNFFCQNRNALPHTMRAMSITIKARLWQHMPRVWFPGRPDLISKHTHTHPFNGPFSGNTQVSRYQKGKPIWILLKQETVSGSGISWAICKSAPRSRQITMPASHRLVFYRPDALPAAQPTASKHWRHT